jgi:FkbM family methyltransferase
MKFSFKLRLLKKLVISLKNKYGDDNWDSEICGSVPSHNFIFSFLIILRAFVRYFFMNLSHTYNLLEDKYSKDLLVQIIAYRILGYKKVKLPINNEDYWNLRKTTDKYLKKEKVIFNDAHGWELSEFDMSQIGKPISIISIKVGITDTFLTNNYEFKKEEIDISAKPGDYVIDAGGGWGETAINFAFDVGPNGKIFTFEFVPENLKIMNHNLSLNQTLEPLITIIQKPLTQDSNITFYCENNNGLSTRISKERYDEKDIKLESISIDDFLTSDKIEKVDLIKMDIEGSELSALKGAKNTIKKFRPKLMICLYHKPWDFVEIPKFLSELDCNYDFYINHNTIFSDETILFANHSDN